MQKKAMIAMSGGVDSSVAAYLMVQDGYDCAGATLKLYDNPQCSFPGHRACCTPSDTEDARSVAARLGMLYYVFPMHDEFRHSVIDKFADTYLHGGTPNPCIDCNRYLKFGRLLERAEDLNYDYVATGHYAVIEYNEETGRYNLRKSKDLKKDQTYVLYNMTQDMLAHTIFPLGSLTKEEVREIAEENEFINAKKAESMDICFVKGTDYASFIENYTDKKYPEGDFIDMQGNVIGRHKGIIRYTIGQRKGLGVSFGKPMFVYSKNAKDNTVTLASDEELMSHELFANKINLIPFNKLEKPMKVKARARYNMVEQPAIVEQIEDDLIKVTFDEPQRAFAKGQAVVLYDGDYVVGGGTII